MKLSIKDVRAIFAIDCEIPSGGVVEITGDNGVGKTTVLEIVRALAGADESFEPRDGCERGTAELGERKLSITQHGKRASGPLPKGTVISDAQPDVLIDPQIADEASADAARMKAACTLLGVEAKSDAFGELANLASPETLKAKTLPDMAGKLKRDVEAQAREEAKQHTLLMERAAQNAQKIEIDETVETDAAKLAKAVSDARLALARAEAKNESAQAVHQQAVEAKAKLAEHAKIEDVGLLRDTRNALLDEHARLAARLAEIADNARNLGERIAISEAQALALSSARAVIAKAEATPLVALQPLTDAVEDAELRGHIGTVMREEIERRATRLKLLESANLHGKNEILLRAQAGEVWTCVAQALAKALPPEMSIEDGRLYYQDPKRKKRALFSSLSTGMRAKPALQMLAYSQRDAHGTLAGKDATIICSLGYQWWAALQPAEKEAFHKLCVEERIVPFVERPTDGPLEARVFGEEKAPTPEELFS